MLTSRPRPLIAGRAWVLCGAALMLAACGQWPHYQRSTMPEIVRETPPATTLAGAGDGHEAAVPMAAAPAAQKFPATGPLVGEGSVAGPRSGTRGEVVLNFNAAPIDEVVKVILGDTLKQNYVIEPGVTGTVSIQSHLGFSQADLVPVLERLLAVNNAVLLREADGVYRVMPRDKVKASIIPALASRSRGTLSAGYRTELVGLRYISAAELMKVLQPFLSEQVEVNIDAARNAVMLAGSGNDIGRLRQTIAVFDVDWLAGMSVGLFPVNFTEARTVIAELQAVFGMDGKDPIDGILRLVPIERLNSILVVTPQPEYLDRVEMWLGRLDRPGSTDERRLYVYRVQNGKAPDLAAVLNEILEERAGGDRSVPPAELAPGLEPVELHSTEPPTGPADARPVEGIAVGSHHGFRIIADLTNNALVLMATQHEYRMVLAALRQLDVTPLQVLIEASIVEVSLADDLRYGVEWFFKNNVEAGGSNKQGSGLLDLGAAGLSSLTPGFSYALIDDAAQVRAVINLLATESELNVLSSPSLMVLSNQKATINVGDEVPIPTRQAVSNIDPDAPTVNEIGYRDTGVILEVLPRVNNGGLVTMEISQEVSDVGPTTTSGIDAPTFQQRKLGSTVAVQSGNTVVLGGLIRDRVTTDESGIPGLYKLPVVGKLFGATSNAARRTELLVVITPRAISNASQASAVTEEFRNKLQGMAIDRTP